MRLTLTITDSTMLAGQSVITPAPSLDIALLMFVESLVESGTDRPKVNPAALMLAFAHVGLERAVLEAFKQTDGPERVSEIVKAYMEQSIKQTGVAPT